MPEEKNFNESLMEQIKIVRDENRETKRDLNKRMDELGKRMDGIDKRMDRIETRMDKLENKIDKLSDKLDSSLKEIRDLVVESQKDIRNSERHSQILTSTIVSIVVVVLLSFLNH